MIEMPSPANNQPDAQRRTATPQQLSCRQREHGFAPLMNADGTLMKMN